tara:strand:- start:518 stop:916 length:399 start_codon:yes stop_codon:yes gene_type:complete
MSEVKTNKLTGVGTAGSIVVTGEGNSTTTNLQQGLAKVWQSTDVTTLNDSNNVASVTDTATGKLTVNYTANMANNDYAVTMNCAIQSQVPICSPQDNSHITTSAHRCHTLISNGGSEADAEYIGSQVTGDLA